MSFPASPAILRLSQIPREAAPPKQVVGRAGNQSNIDALNSLTTKLDEIKNYEINQTIKAQRYS
jgi:hypothetical protein